MGPDQFTWGGKEEAETKEQRRCEIIHSHIWVDYARPWFQGDEERHFRKSASLRSYICSCLQKLHQRGVGDCAWGAHEVSRT